MLNNMDETTAKMQNMSLNTQPSPNNAVDRDNRVSADRTVSTSAAGAGGPTGGGGFSVIS